MTLRLQDKQAIVAELAGVVGHAISAIAADYRGLTVSEMTELRVNARRAGIHMRVYRNTLARRAVQETSFACLSDVLVGPVVLLFSQDDPGAAARLIGDFAKTHEALQVRGLALEGRLLGPEQLKAVASLPTRHEALARLAATLNAPITQFVRTLKEPVAQTVRVVAAVQDKKQANN